MLTASVRRSVVLFFLETVWNLNLRMPCYCNNRKHPIIALVSGLLNFGIFWRYFLLLMTLQSLKPVRFCILLYKQNLLSPPWHIFSWYQATSRNLINNVKFKYLSTSLSVQHINMLPMWSKYIPGNCFIYIYIYMYIHMFIVYISECVRL